MAYGAGDCVRWFSLLFAQASLKALRGRWFGAGNKP